MPSSGRQPCTLPDVSTYVNLPAGVQMQRGPWQLPPLQRSCWPRHEVGPSPAAVSGLLADLAQQADSAVNSLIDELLADSSEMVADQRTA